MWKIKGYPKNGVAFEELLKWEQSNETRIANNDKIRLVKTKTESNSERCISEKNYSHKCFVGDFNFRDIYWEYSSTNTITKIVKENKFIETIRD